MHVNRLAQELKASKVLIPLNPGLTSAMGLLMTDLKNNYETTLIQDLASVDLDKVNSIYREFSSNASALLAQEGIEEKEVANKRSFDMRYVGQSYELEIPVPGNGLAPSDLEKIADAFHSQHERSYGHSTKDEPIEIVNVKMTAIGRLPRAKPKGVKQGGRSPDSALRKNARVFFGEEGDFVNANVYDRYRLMWGNVVEGPAIVEDRDATTVVHPGYKAEVDSYGNLILTVS